MTQQINLYQIQKKKFVLDFTFQYFLWVFWGFCGILVLITSVNLYEHLTIKKELTNLDKEQLAKTQKLQVISGKIPEVQTRDQIEAEIKKYEIDRQEKQEVVTMLDSALANQFNGFAGYFESLAKEAVEGIWLTKITFKDNGNYIGLEGKTINTELVPKLIAGLGTEPVFKGKTFQLFKVVTDEKTHEIDFDLETKTYEQP